MEMKAIFIVACLYLVLFIPGSNGEINDRDYLIVVPRVLRGGTTVNIGINIFGNISCDVELKLYDSVTRDVVSRAKGHFLPNEAGELKLEVPKIRISTVGATVCGIETTRRKISYQALTEKIFIQTDKPIYKPGQKVRIRILHVNNELKPAGNKISSVVVQEPSGSKIMQWTNVQLDDGIARLDLELSKDPVPGIWKIKAIIKDRIATKQIEIDKYVLPKFQLEIKPPPYFARDQTEIPVSICARYTYGKDVTGLLDATFCLKHIWRSDDCVKEVKNITGCEEFNAKELLKLESIYWWSWSAWQYFIQIKAVFTETSTGVKRKNEATSPRFKQYSKTMSFVGLDKKFKPGFPFEFKIKVTYLDGKPVTDARVDLEVLRTRFYYQGTRRLLQETYFVKSGVIPVVIKDMPHDTEKLHFKASYNSYNIRQYATSQAWFSPSLSYLQLIKTGQSTGKVGDQGSVKVLHTSRNGATNHNFHHKIMCKGNLVLSGSTKENLTSDGHLESDGFRTPLPTDHITTDTPIHPFRNIPQPHVKEFEIKFNITQEMVPSCRILVYYIRADRETVGDSILYDIEDKLENQVSIEFTEKQKKPGERTTIIMKAKPGSRVAISALDKSVLLLRNSNEVKKSEVLRILNGQDVGPIQGYEGNCQYSFSKPHVGDVSEAFNMAGVVFLSNLNVFTQPCYHVQQQFYEENDRPVTYPPTRYWGFGTTPFTHAALTRTPTNAPTHALTEAAAEALLTTETIKSLITTRLLVKKKKPIKKVKVRKNFPETWLWTDVKLNDTSGVQTMEVQVPDTITSWVANGFAMSSVYGMAISDRAKLKAFQPFFVQMTLPYSVIRGEEVPIIVTVFNYLSSCVPIRLQLIRKVRHYRVTSFSITKMCVCGDDGKSVKFKIIPKRLGRVPLKVKAITSEANLCPKSTVYAADAVTRKLLVEPEGIIQEYTSGTFFCPGKGNYNETINLALPKDIIPGSVLPKISVVGDVMGPALNNLDGLLAMPYGCGEQNMAKFAPNIYIMDYLTNTDQATQKLKDSAIHYMNSGYQRQLRYKRSRGSYSAFGNSDRQGSMMLTAFVVRSFARARKYIFIDDDEIKHSFNWFERKQNPDSGCFSNYGRVFDKSLQGGVNSDLTITAYVTIALLEAGLKTKTTMVSKAFDCIMSKLDDIDDSYSTSLVTYALVLANHSKAGVMMNRLKKKAIMSKGDQLFWSASKADSHPRYYDFGYTYYRPPADVEMTAYALMSYLKRKNSIDDVLKIVKWLSKQRNNYGGFSSTQDTCVALQALSEVAQKFYAQETSTNLNISVNIGGIFGHNFQLADHNKLILQRAEIPSNVLPNKLNLVASGSGCALVQSSVKYNIPIPEEPPAFDVEVSVHRREAEDEEEIKACYPLQLKITAKWLKEDVSNMAIVDVKLVSGFTVSKELLEQKLEAANDVGQSDTILKRYEIEGQNVILYFDEIKTMSFSLGIFQSMLVKKTKPGVVRVYDYYEPESQGKVLYNITEQDCYGEKIEKECPKCISVNNFEEFFDKNINCSVYLMRAKSVNGQMKVSKAYIKANKTENNKIRSYEIPEFCPCDEVFDGVKSLVLGQSDYFRHEKNGEEASIVFNSATTIARWNSKRMKKIFRKKMTSKIYRRCKRLAKG